MSADPPRRSLWSAEECARQRGIPVHEWDNAVYGGQEPLPAVDQPGLRLWDSSTVRNWRHYGLLADDEWYAQHGAPWQQRLARRVAELDILAVSPDARGQGIAYRLLRAVRSILSANGSTQLLVQVHQDNTQALAWFTRQGFTLPDPDTLVLLKFEGHSVGFDSLNPDGYRQGLLSITGP